MGHTPEHEAAYPIILALWNAFAKEHHYPKIEKLTVRCKNQLRGLMQIHKNFLRDLPEMWGLIHKNCTVNEWGSPLDFRQFIRSTVYLKALMIQKELDSAKARKNA